MNALDLFEEGGPPVAVLPGNCLARLAALDADQFHAVVTDPPYHLESIVQRFTRADGGKAARAKAHRDGAFQRASDRFRGRTWDDGDVAFQAETWATMLRVTRPGGWLVAFADARTYHRMATAIEAAGWEVRRPSAWLYGTGQAFTHPVDKSLAKLPQEELGDVRPEDWEGWGTAVRSAWEPVAVARKPLSESSVARQVIATGTGALNTAAAVTPGEDGEPDRFPCNVAHDGSTAVLADLPGGAGRFFFHAKATAEDRAGSDHPTVKPLGLMRWLLRLHVRPGGLVLDPFAGSGSTGWAAAQEGVRAVLVERESDYLAHLHARLASLSAADAAAPAPDALPGQGSLFGDSQ